MNAPPTHKRKIDGVPVESTELPIVDASDMLPEMLPALAPIVALFASGSARNIDGARLQSLIVDVATSLGGGRLRRLQSRLLAETVVTAPVGDKGQLERVELTSEANINRAFLGPRKKIFFQVLAFAVEVNFLDFFDGAAIAALMAAGKTQSTSAGSSASTEPAA